MNEKPNLTGAGAARVQPGPPAPVRWVAAVAIVLLACAVLGLHAGRYGTFFSDDAFISLRYADRFLEAKGLTWNDGERVEGYSNLLWILLVSGLGKLGLDLVMAARVLGCLGMAAVIAAVVAACPPRRNSPLLVAALPAAVGATAVALTGPVAVWAIGGLEQPLLAALVAWGAVLLMPAVGGRTISRARLLAAGTLWGLAAITRPDGALFAAVGCAAVVLAGRFAWPAWKRALLVALVPALFFAGQLVFRLWYYGDWLPNPAYTKVAFHWARLRGGLAYVGMGALALSPLLLLAAWGAFACLRRRPTRGPALLVTLLTLAWLAYVAAVGGDIFPGWRHLTVVAALAAMPACWGVRWLAKRRGGAMAAGVAVAALVALGALQYRDAENRRAIQERWEWDGQVVGEFLHKTLAARRPVLAVDPAGCLPYFSRLASIDMLGINDHHIARHPPPDFGAGRLGHDFGDGKYVLARKPDLVLFDNPRGSLNPLYRGSREMMADPAFLDDYQPVVFDCGRRAGETVTSLIYVRREGRGGIHRDEGRIVVPGHFLSPRERWTADVPVGPSGSRKIAVGHAGADDDGCSGGLISPGTESIVTGVSVPEGRWRVLVQPQDALVQISCRRCAPADPPLPPAPNDRLLDVPPGGARLDLVVTNATALQQHVHDVVLEKQ